MHILVLFRFFRNSHDTIHYQSIGYLHKRLQSLKSSRQLLVFADSEQ